MARKEQLTLGFVLLVGLCPIHINGVIVFRPVSYPGGNFYEHPDPWELIATVTAYDGDRSGNVSFSIADSNFAGGIVVLANKTSSNHFYSVNLLVGPNVTNSTFDYDERPRVTILIGAINSLRASATVPVIVELADINDNAPVFQSTVIKVLEDAPVNESFHTLQATDRDSDLNGHVEYDNLTQSDVFDIQYTGDIILLQPLDYETQRIYNIRVIAMDLGISPMSTTAELMIMVQDVDDNNPVFLRMGYSAQVHENLTVGSKVLQVSARDGDEGINNTIMYTISDSSTFTINSSTGYITLYSSLDRETNPSYNLRVTATEMTNNMRHNSTDIEITILDINDNYPVFDRLQYIISINETTPLRTVTILTVTATDPDEDDNARTTYSFNQSVPFAINQHGEITVVMSLDYETQDMYTFEVIAEDSSEDVTMTGSGSYPSSTTVIVNLVNNNDEYPQFLNAPYDILIEEHSDNGDLVVTLNVTDRDIGTSGDVVVSITNYEDIFEIVNNDEIIVKNSSLLDYEIETQYIIDVVATDMGIPPLTMTSMVVVDLNNTNDNVPIITCEPVEVMENSQPGLPFTTITASDADGDMLSYMINADQSYPAGVEQYFTFSDNELVATSVELDYENFTKAVLNIMVTDGEHFSNCSLNINITDDNDNTPVIVSQRFNVSENAEVGRLIGTINATDEDSGVYAVISYSLAIDDTNFTINAITGELHLAASLDYEDRRSLVITVLAIDDPDGNTHNTGSATITIRVVDVNDNSPVFTEQVYEASVFENAEAFAFKVTAEDRDSGTNAQITYDIVLSSVDITGLLTINESSGVISKRRVGNFNREETPYINLTVMAYDDGSPSQNGTAQVIIMIQDINDNLPVFLRNYTFNVTENETTNSLVGVVSATDRDEGNNAIIRYEIRSPTMNVPFRLDSNNPGHILVKELLNREDDSLYTLIIGAGDPANSSDTDRTTVTINILDVNDNPPQFSQTSYRTTVPESITINSTILTITATDADIYPNNIICYSIMPVDGMTLPISIDNRTGVITVDSELDFDQDGFVPTILTFVYATDSPDCEMDENYFVTFISFLLIVTDVNDNHPQFVGTNGSALTNMSYGIIISEGADIDYQFNTSVVVTDADDGEFGRITLTTNTTDFAVRLSDQDLLIVEILTELDRETIDNYIILVIATDGGGRSSYLNLIISLGDVNEFPPVFSDSNGYVTNITEGEYSHHDFYTGIVAEDIETNGRATIMYRLQDQPHPLFSINEISGTVTVNGTIDRETNNSFVLVIVAYEEAMPVDLSSNTTLTINVIDVNDNKPVISSCSSDAVPETNITGSSVLTVMASDKDVVGELRYYIEDNRFTINSTTGVITNNNELDYEGIREFNFTVIVSDSVSNVSEDCSIMLSDVNDNTPHFIAGCCNNVNITENTAVGSLLPVTINATDDDSGPNGQVTLSPMFSFIDKFELLPNGSINVTGVLDYETQSRYTLVVVATDNATYNRLSSSVTIVVNLKNENDNDPSFNSSIYEFTMIEHEPNGTIVGQVVVSDADGNSLTLSVLNGPYFAVNNSGIVTSNGGMNFFDYDNLPIKYHFAIIASDHDGRTDRANVVVTLIDDNDHPPVFTQDYNTTLGTGDYSGQPILALVASDEDSANNGRISYSIQSDSFGGLFTMDNVTGLLSVNGNLVTGTMVYTLEVLAMDHGNPPLYDTTAVTVNVIELSDTLQFDNTSYSIDIFENITTDDEILMLSVEGGMQYFLATNISEFIINSTNGLLTTTRSLDYERDPHVYIFTVGAVSDSMPHSTALAMVTVNLLDVNDNSPAFIDSNNAQVYVPEDSDINTTIYLLSTVDADSAINSNTGYQIVASNVSSLFSINETGHLLLNQMVDRESATQYQLTIIAYDIEIPSQNSSINITVNVVDSNDHNPVFTEPFYYVTISEAASNGTKVVTVMATDQDDDINGEIFFTIIDGDNRRHFTIANTRSCQGTIYTSGNPTDRELDPIINLTIQASDKGLPPRTSNATVIITLLDVNDNVPILNTTGPFGVLENATAIRPVLTLSAYDEDLPNKGYSVVGFSLSEDFNNLFWLNFTTGELFITEALNRETVVSYDLTVELQDTPTDGTQANSNSFTVTINVLDVNDNDPQFVPVTMPLRISEMAPRGTVVTTLTATDDDEGSNANIIMNIVSVTPSRDNTHEPFGIDTVSLTGLANLTITSSLDREVTPLYTVTVRAADMGNPVRSSLMTFNVLVTDVNDNSPVFIMQQFGFSVSENASIGATVGRLSAVDLDDTTLRYGYRSNATSLMSLFNINETTGVISVAGTLDRETNATFYFVAEVSDNVNIQDTAEVYITVSDINDNPPEFSSDMYTGSITEGSLPSVVVMISPTIMAMDRDEMNTQNSQITYSLLNGDQGTGAEYFIIDPATAIIEVSLEGHNNLDYEKRQQFNLTLQAEDGGAVPRSRTARLVISVIDVNDNPPVFTGIDNYTIQVTEEQELVNGMLPLSLYVTATDADSDGVNGAVSYYIDGDTSLFAINNETGQLSAIRQIDAEENDQYNLTVVARDGSSPFNTATAPVLVFVIDINDNAPQFNASQYQVSISETAQGETTGEHYVTTLGITDADRSINNSMLSVTVHSDKFDINPENHDVFTIPASTLDRENSSTEQFVVTACDHGVHQECSNATVIVTLLDVNDNDPQFDQPNYTITITRSQLVDSTVAVFIAQDQDVGSNAELHYSLESNATEEIFQINTITGSLILNQAISPSLINNSIELVITATDQGVPSRSGNVTVIVMIFEEISVVPVFDQSVYSNESVVEGRPAGTHVVTVSASSTISDIQYTIEHPSVPFIIDAQGSITTTMRLSREDATSYSFSVRAFNNVENGFALVIVTIIDANDHSPQFEDLPYEFSVVEHNEVNQLIGHVTATDQDSGTNAKLQYSITAGNENNLFYINPFNGSLYANQSFDREETSSYNISVVVADMGLLPLNVSTNVTITILDQNDNPPVIQNINVFNGNLTISMDNMSVIVIPEDQPTFERFIQFNVTDLDDGNNGEFTFSLQDSSNNFVIDRFQGELWSIRELDHEATTNVFTLTITVTDRGQQAHSIEHRLIVNVSDVNDCVPEFNAPSSRSITINEEQRNGTLITEFTATDCDSGNNGLIQYNITSGNNNGYFAINRSTGRLSTNARLDREEKSQYTLVVTAADLGMPSHNTSIEFSVELRDINDNAPQFVIPPPQNINVSESIRSQSILFTVSATDDDTSSSITYLITPSVFVISPIGVVTLAPGESLDREIVNRYNVTVTATDGTNANNTQLIVIVEDVNDNAPVFAATSCQGTIEVLEHEVNAFVCQVSATDADEGTNGRIVYSFVTAQQNFTLNSTTGRIYTKGSLDREVQSIYNLGVRAEDQGTVPVSNTVNIIVSVEDINDNPPQFLQDVYSGLVMENADNNSVIVTVSATDADTASNNVEIVYAFTGDMRYADRFAIDSTSGVIRNVAQLDRENVSVYNITVVGTNINGSPMLNDTALVIITVLDVNEFPPVFLSPPSRVNVSEFFPPTNDLILQLAATDMDDNPNVEYSYTLVTRIPNSPFSLGSANGQFLLTGTLDFEQRSQYNLMFQVSDGERSSNANIIIEVIDENDNIPYFANVDTDGFIHATVVEGESDVVITRLITEDADTDKINTDSTVHLVSATGMTSNMDAFDHFEVDPLTGDVKVLANMSLDREESESFILNVTVNNTSPGVGCLVNPNLYSCNLINSAELLVTVIDINDNPPVFTRSMYNGDITTTVGVGQRVVQVEATDQDEMFGPIIYELNIKSGKALNMFGIDKITGEVVTQASFLDSAGENFTFSVLAKDNGGVGIYHSAEATVSVIVLDNLQRVVITFQCHQSLIAPQANEIRSVLENITGYFINLEIVEPHYERDRNTGERLTANVNLTDYVFYAVDRTTNKIVEGEDVIRVLVNKLSQLEDILDDGCKVQSAQAVQQLLIASEAELGSSQFVLIIIAGLIGFGGVLMLCLSYRQRYIGTHLRKQGYKADIFYGLGENNLEDIERRKITTRTENYEMVGEPITQNQPMIVQPYQDWNQPGNVEIHTSEKALERDNPLYESQEIRMEMFADMSETDFSEDDEAGLLAAAIADEDDDEDADELVTAI